MVKQVWAVRLPPEIIEGLTKVPNARNKVQLFCEGLVAINKKQSQIAAEEKLKSKEIFSPENKPITDVLHSEEDKIELPCMHDYEIDQELLLLSNPPKRKKVCKKCGHIDYETIGEFSSYIKTSPGPTILY